MPFEEVVSWDFHNEAGSFLSEIFNVLRVDFTKNF